MSRLILPDRNILVPRRVRVGGFFKLTGVNAYTGAERAITQWFPNLITDYGLNKFGTTSPIVAAHVGTGNSVPSVSDVALSNYRSGTVDIQTTETGAAASSPYYGWRRLTFRFGLGAASGNLAEVGISATLLTGQLFSRSLIVDGFDVPTTVTVLTDEYLDVSYELRCYAPLNTTDYVTEISTTPYDCQTRASAVTDPANWAPSFSQVTYRQGFGVPAHTYYSGAIGAITAGPSGTTGGAATGTQLAYSNNSLHSDFVIFAGLDIGNVAGGIRSTFVSTTLGAFQTEFNPVIDKTNTRTLSLTYRIGWGRYTPGSP